MENRKNSEPRDVTQEPYAGTGRVASGFGYTTMLHFGTHAAFMGGLAIAALIAPQKAKATIQWFENKSANYKEMSGIRGIAGRFGTWLIGVPTGTYAHLNAELGTLKNVSAKLAPPSPELLQTVQDAVKMKERGILPNIAHHFVAPFKLDKADDGKWEGALVAAGLGAMLSTIFSTIVGFVHGGKKGEDGRRQFQRAQEQINNLREDNEDLNKINDELHAKYVTAATRLDSIQAANAARNEAPLASEASSPQPAPTNEVQLDEAQHLGKSAMPEIANSIAK